MGNEQLKPPVSMKPSTPAETPYLRAKEEWDSRIGQTVVQAKNWRLVAVSVSFIACILAGGVVLLATQQKLIPVVIALNKDSGEPAVLGQLAELNYKPQLQEIKYFIGEFIQKVRSVPSDPVIIKKNWMDAYVFLRRDAANKLNSITNSDQGGALKHIGKQTVIVQPISATQVGNSNSYQTRWREYRYNKNGGLMEKYNMSGVFTIEIETPENEKILSVNPLGIFITNFGWSREL